MAKKLPPTIYVFYEGDASGKEQYLRAHVDPVEALDKPGDKVRVGVYELKEIVTVEATLAVKKSGRAR